MNDKHNIFGYVLISSGYHSDYQTTPFRVLKPFSFAAAAAEYRAQYKPGDRLALDDCAEAIRKRSNT